MCVPSNRVRNLPQHHLRWVGETRGRGLFQRASDVMVPGIAGAARRRCEVLPSPPPLPPPSPSMGTDSNRILTCTSWACPAFPCCCYDLSTRPALRGNSKHRPLYIETLQPDVMVEEGSCRTHCTKRKRTLTSMPSHNCPLPSPSSHIAPTLAAAERCCSSPHTTWCCRTA
jgi:hypothetical protein